MCCGQQCVNINTQQTTWKPYKYLYNNREHISTFSKGRVENSIQLSSNLLDEVSYEHSNYLLNIRRLNKSHANWLSMTNSYSTSVTKTTLRLGYYQLLLSRKLPNIDTSSCHSLRSSMSYSISPWTKVCISYSSMFNLVAQSSPIFFTLCSFNVWLGRQKILIWIFF